MPKKDITDAVKKKDVLGVTEKYVKEIKDAVDAMQDEDLVRPGHCPFCEREIFHRNKVTKLPTMKNDFYRDYWVRLENGSKMRIGVCDQCIEILDDALIQDYMRRERNTQVYQTFAFIDKEGKPLSDQKKAKITGFVSQYKAIGHGRQEKDI